ncbi:MAG TPA: M20/M25/M40 family metallo-hydrolase [Candidatus Binatia bacterium]|nr:M20/M25/M40 family metallo-hydrolase [Candidatus Binatia bacterium]
MVIQDIDAEACLETLCSIVRMNSCSGTPGESVLAQHLAEQMKLLGLETELQEIGDGRYNAVARLRGKGGGKHILLNGHIDTNPLTLGWTVDPWGGIRNDKFVFGLGCSNMKAGASAYFCAVRELLKQRVQLAGDVFITFVCGELQGGIGTLKLVEKGLAADYFIVGEPTDLAALTMHAGTFDFEIDLTGQTRHMSKREEAGDALAAVCTLALRINELRFEGAANHEHEALVRSHVGTLRAALTPEFDESRRVQVADFARLAGSCRYSPSQSREIVADTLQELTDEVCGKYANVNAVVREFLRPGVKPMLPFEVDRSSPIVQSMNQNYERLTGKSQPTGAIRPSCFFNSDASHLQNFGGIKDGIVCGPGGRYNTMPDERVDIEDYLTAIKLYASVVTDLCGIAAR